MELTLHLCLNVLPLTATLELICTPERIAQKICGAISYRERLTSTISLPRKPRRQTTNEDQPGSEPALGLYLLLALFDFQVLTNLETLVLSMRTVSLC